VKFRFRLETVLRQRKIEQDLAQKDHAEAAAAVRDQLAKIKRLYSRIDDARLRAENIQKQGGTCLSDLQALEAFIVGQKQRIVKERQVARELMAVEEEKHDVLVECNKAFKILEKLKEKKKLEFKVEKNKKEVKRADDIVTMRFHPEGKR
jgi:flagellar FliJ protein